MISESGRQLLDIMFREGEEVCVSHDGYGYHSIPLSSLEYSTVELKAPPESKLSDAIIDTSEIKLVSLNPTKGFRRDENVTAFRNFLIEVDDMDLADQLRYVDGMQLPYSVCVFSGNKSLHFSICLEDSLPSYKLYYYYATWILNIMSGADQKTKNPTRSIRFAGAIRDGKEQKLVKIKPRIQLADLNSWLSQYEGQKPKGFFDENKPTPIDKDKENHIPKWVWDKVINGIDKSKGRNVEWFKIASEFGKLGYDAESAIGFLEQYFVSEYDFKRNEWATTIKSGIKNGRKKAGLE
jgi:hypothetical protein